MGKIPRTFSKIDGRTFSKMFGSGGGTGFKVNPNFSVYAMMHVWENRSYADQFFASDFYQQMKNESSEQWTVFFKSYKILGTWDKKNPFKIDTERNLNAPVVIITRASIRPKYVVQFWKRVPAITKFLNNSSNALFSIGIGEIPWFYQVTFSIWETEEEMIAFAHKDKHHSSAAKKSMDEKWFKEYMFNRFYLTDSMGSWKGENPLNQLDFDNISSSAY